MIYQSQVMQELARRIGRCARTSASVLILGESGTGKELVARQLHNRSGRGPHPYIAINCAAFHEQLMESDLFGHEQGAFTGATRCRKGCFELAGPGTVFLDELAEMTVPLQAKLLRVLESAEIRRVGGSEPVPIRARVLAATNRDLPREILSGRFREDLYHRLNVLTLRIPPLRERRQDIPLLVAHFIQQFHQEGEVVVRGVSSTVMRRLVDYHWPGNVRQLRNAMHRACIEAEEELIEDIELSEEGPEGVAMELSDLDHLPLKDVERLVILARLRRFNGNRTEAAADLGVTPRTLRNKVQQYRRLGLNGPMVSPDVGHLLADPRR
jgi:DNA-binding NtrC family response regulator